MSTFFGYAPSLEDFQAEQANIDTLQSEMDVVEAAIADLEAGASAYRTVVAKTADYSVVAADNGKIFTTRGAEASVTFTLPAITGLTSGWNCRFFNVADVSMTIASAAGDDIVTFNNAAADSVAFGTEAEVVGNGVEVVFDGTGWLAFVSNPGTLTVGDS